MEKTGSSGLVDTYTITFTNGETVAFYVTNGEKGDTGVGVSYVEYVETQGLYNIYRIVLTNGISWTFWTKNGEDGAPGVNTWGDITGVLADQTDLKTALDGKAAADHNHDERYYTESEVNTLLSGKAAADHTHGNITKDGAITADTAAANGDKLVVTDASGNSKLIRSGIAFDGSTVTKALSQKGTWEPFAASDHNHDERYYTETETDALLSGKAPADHTHDERYYTETEVNALLSGKAAADHNHDERYYTESEMDALLSETAPLSHDHDERYYTQDEMFELLAGKANLSHTHGNITKDGEIKSDMAIQAGDKLVIADKTNGWKLYRTGIEFDSSSTSKALSQKGTWEPFATADHTHDERYYTESEMNTKLAAKQDTLTFDTAPTANSTNPVTSGGVKTALDGKAASDHNHDGVYAAADHNHDGTYAAASHNHDERYYTGTEMNALLAAKQDTLTFDTAPTANSTNPVTSGGVKTALDGKAASDHNHDGVYAAKSHTHEVETVSVGSASAGTAIAADDITEWSAGTLPSISVSNGVIKLGKGSVPVLSYAARSIPNISVTSKTVVTGIS